MQGKKGLTGTVGRWSAHHPWTAITVWILFVAVAIFAGNAAGTNKVKAADSGAGESGKAGKVLERAGFAVEPGEQLLVQSPRLNATDPAFRAVVGDVMTKLNAVDGVVNIENPYDKGTISKDGHAVLVKFDVPGDISEAPSKFDSIFAVTSGARTAHPGFSFYEAGDVSYGKAYNDSQGKDFAQAEQLSLPITLLILVVTFGGLLLAGIPVVLAMSAVMGAFGLTALASQLMPVPDATQSVILLIGLAVGVDYSLFYLARQRQEQHAGHTKLDSIDIAAATSGRAVLVSGITVLIAMSGMFLAGNSVFSGIALGTMLVVATAMIGSLTVLPAMLAPKSAGVLARIPGHRAVGTFFRLIGKAISYPWRLVTWPFRQVQSLARKAKGETPIWERILRPVLRRPVVSVVSATAVLVALALPGLSLTLGLSPTTYGLPSSSEYIKGTTAIEKTFPGSPSPAVLVVHAPNVTAQPVREGIAAFEKAALKKGVAHPPFTLRLSKDHTTIEMIVPIAGNGHDAAAKHSVELLRSTIIPSTVGAVPGVETQVTGEAAGVSDFNQLMHDRAPIVIGFVLLMSFLLLLVTFRSLIVPIKAIILNLLSVGAAYGILVAVFQHTWAESILGFKTDGAIESWLPIFLFVVLFGLSMDYHVFILSRVRELWERGMTSEQAVARGIADTAGVVSSAALVMVAVFGVFATLSGLDMKQLGVGLASAILIDATIIRAVLLPAAMKLLGDRNWYLPKALDWLPHINHGGPTQPQPVAGD
jgi:putative drug exporter of the RND superfamily